MICKDISFKTPAENILFDDALLHWAEKQQGEEVLRFWESPCDFIVLGRIGKVSEEIKENSVQEDRIPVIRRSSGGGTVLQGKGCLNYACILTKEKHPPVKDLKNSYIYILEKVVSALGRIGISSCFYPISDIALKGSRKKISGNAQRRLRHCILHHGTLLYDFDLKKIERYLQMPQSVPEYRNHRTHLDFVSNIFSADIEGFKRGLMDEFEISDLQKELSSPVDNLFKEFQKEHKLLEL